MIIKVMLLTKNRLMMCCFVCDMFYMVEIINVLCGVLPHSSRTGEHRYKTNNQQSHHYSISLVRVNVRLRYSNSEIKH